MKTMNTTVTIKFDEETTQTLRVIADALARMVHGPTAGPGSAPMGLEAVAMALAGEGPFGKNSVAHALHSVSGAIEQLTDKVDDVQSAIRSHTRQ